MEYVHPQTNPQLSYVYEYPQVGSPDLQSFFSRCSFGEDSQASTFMAYTGPRDTDGSGGPASHESGPGSTSGKGTASSTAAASAALGWQDPSRPASSSGSATDAQTPVATASNTGAVQAYTSSMGASGDGIRWGGGVAASMERAGRSASSSVGTFDEQLPWNWGPAGQQLGRSEEERRGSCGGSGGWMLNPLMMLEGSDGRADAGAVMHRAGRSSGDGGGMLGPFAESGIFSGEAGTARPGDGEHGGDPSGWMLNPLWGTRVAAVREEGEAPSRRLQAAGAAEAASSSGLKNSPDAASSSAPPSGRENAETGRFCTAAASPLVCSESLQRTLQRKLAEALEAADVAADRTPPMGFFEAAYSVARAPASAPAARNLIRDVDALRVSAPLLAAAGAADEAWGSSGSEEKLDDAEALWRYAAAMWPPPVNSGIASEETAAATVSTPSSHGGALSGHIRSDNSSRQHCNLGGAEKPWCGEVWSTGFGYFGSSNPTGSAAYNSSSSGRGSGSSSGSSSSGRGSVPYWGDAGRAEGSPCWSYEI